MNNQAQVQGQQAAGPAVLVQALDALRQADQHLGQQTAAIAQAQIDANAVSIARALKREWLEDEKSKIDVCEGAPAAARTRSRHCPRRNGDASDCFQRLARLLPGRSSCDRAL